MSAEGTSGARAVGVDGCRAGWIAAIAGPEGTLGFRAFATIGGLSAWRDAEAPDAPVALDIPMGLTELGGFRPCDLLARRALGRAASSVFAPPGRYLLGTTSYEEVRRLVEERRAIDPSTPGLSAQAAGIIGKIAEVDAYLRADPDAQRWLLEVHPELSFRRWAGTPLRPKRSPAGAIQRLRLVRERFPNLEDALAASAAAPAAGVGLDDALDACAALWTALRWGAAAEVLGGQRDGSGLVMRMVV